MEPKSITYDYCDLYTERTVGVVKSLSTGSTELYEDRGNVGCVHCKLTGKQCIGHIGYFKLPGLYLNPLFQEECANLKACICKQCEKPYASIPKGCSEARRYLHNKLLYYYSIVAPKNFERIEDNGEEHIVSCSCVQKAAIQKWDSSSLAIYILTRETKDCLIANSELSANTNFQKMFDCIGLSPATKLLCKYVPVIPHKVISLMTEAKEVSNAYKSLDDAHKRLGNKGNLENIQTALDALFRSIFSTITGKEGVARQFMVTVHASTSCRAVIVGDPTLPINRIRISKGVAKTLLRELQVSKENYDSVLDWVTQKRVHQVLYKNDKYRLLEPKVYTACTIQIIQNGMTIGEGLSILGDEDRLEYYEGESKVSLLVGETKKSTLLELLNSTKVVELKVTGIEDVHEDQFSSKLFVVSNSAINTVRCSDNVLPGGETMVPIMLGIRVNCVDDNGTLTVHRNPVMSADSIRMLKSQIDSRGPEVSLNSLEKHQQKKEIANTKYLTGSKPGGSSMLPEDPNAPKVKYIPMRTPEVPFGTVTGVRTLCKIVNISPTYDEERPYENNSKVLAINPVITPGYNADFDGDEMNVRVANSNIEEEQELSIVTDCLREKEGKAIYGPQHDGKYGVWVFVNNKGTLQCAISNAMSEFEIRYQKWSESDTKQVDPIFVKLEAQPRNLQGTKRESNMLEVQLKERERLCNLLRYWKRCNSEQCYGTMVDEFVSAFFHNSNRDKGLLDSLTFNNKAYKYYEQLSELEEFREVYDVSSEDGFAKFYSNVCMALYNFCDAYGMSIDYEGEMAKEIVESGCRPSKATYQTLYGSHGNVVFMLPGNKQFRVWISGNCSKGFTPQEYEKMAYKTRADLATKAKTAAPNGDAMRRWATYLTGTKKVSETWSVRGVTFLREPKPVEDSTRKMLNFARGTYVFSRELDLNCESIEYIKEEDMSLEVKQLCGKELHRGQRKLLLSEIEFLTKHLQEEDYVIYAGAAPGTHLSALLRMFPRLRLHLYDTEKIKIKEDERVSVFRELLTKEVILERYSNPSMSNRYLFISDIRSGENYKSAEEKEEAVKVDNELQCAIVALMNPRACLLKFRCPYEKGTTTTLEGKFMIQCWTPRFSTETRIEAISPYRFVEVDNNKYEQSMFVHNLKRSATYDLSVKLEALKADMTKMHCKLNYDYFTEVSILQTYCDKYEKDPEEVYKLLNNIQSCSIVKAEKERD